MLTKHINPMNTNTFILSGLLLLLPGWISAQEHPLILRGSVETDHRLMLRGDQDWAWNENRLDLTLEKRVSPLRVVGNVWIRHLGPSIVEGSGDLFHKDKINPWNLDIRELYAEVHGFLFEDLDMKVGRQTIAWGTADRFNPTSNLNPHDLEDVLDFGRMMGSDAISLQWHFSHQSSLQTVYIPRFQPASMPLRPFSDLFAFPFEIPDIIPAPGTSDQLIMPRNNFSEGATIGMRWRSFAANTDYSLSYVYGRDPLPLPTSVTLSINQDTGVPHIHAPLVYPRHHIIGADLAGSIGRVGVWGEMAVFIPETELIMQVHLPPHQMPIPMPDDEVILKKEPYTKIVVGSDYTFANGTYMNVQYLRGFLHERGRDQLSDYLILQTERTFLQNRLRIQPLAGGVSISEWDDPANHHAWFYTPEVSYQGIDNLVVSIGGYFFDGNGNNIFAGMKEKNMMRLHVKASF